MSINFWSPIKLSIEITIISGILATILGITVGKIMANRTFKGKAIVETIFLLPLVLPPTVVGFLLIIIFGRNSLIGQLIELIFDQPVMFTYWSAVIASTVVAFPLMYQAAVAGFEGVDKDIENAGRMDGANEFQIFIYLTIPQALRMILSGSVMSFARALGEFGATLMFAGNIPGKTQTIPTAIYMAIDTGNMEFAWLWVISIISISFFMLICLNLMKP
ncbi:molybdate ABC transporter permease subunit [Bacillus sp. 1NLA3E]|uniref:molybdate ABC transporter permease subunit n=1 Tax=Bacillus sp. 1NLA3E TaxID=666686 RepID=UPI000247F121|nr:molybdate ABC transporter permease subunit [Bacillus sp. 1NLA3E]